MAKTYEVFMSELVTEAEKEIFSNFHYSKDYHIVSEREEVKLRESISGNIELFKRAEANSLGKVTPSEGDYVKYAESSYARISAVHSGDKFQISNKCGFYLCESGESQSSGTIYDCDIEVNEAKLNLENLVLSDEVKEGRCWTFSNGVAGAHRGIYYHINFKVWNLI